MKWSFDVNFHVENKSLTKYVFSLSSHGKPIWLQWQFVMGIF
jgi:hypothetical protein